MQKVLSQGAKWAVEQKMGLPEDLYRTESGGVLKEADPAEVSDKARDRGKDQLGSIGSGNHFAEIDIVNEIFDEKTAEVFGLQQDQVVILIHTGSRGLGHQTATEYIRTMIRVMPDYNIDLPDRELACVPFSSSEGQAYFKAMCAAANFAWCNRQVITWEMRKVFENLFSIDQVDIRVVYDVAHNIAKIETYEIDGMPEKLIVHRKGATRAFGPGREELPEEFFDTGQPVLIPGSMGTSSFVLAGQKGTETLSFGSCCHGAGRRLSRTAAKKQVNAPSLISELEGEGIFVRAGSYRGVAEEAPIAYKDVDLVVESVQVAGLAKRVARLKPCAVIKG
jgi:tRNA-splicing ligase RtcB